MRKLTIGPLVPDAMVDHKQITMSTYVFVIANCKYCKYNIITVHSCTSVHV